MTQPEKSDLTPTKALVGSIPVVASLGAQVGVVTIIFVLVAVFGGIWLDKLLGTKPVIMVILVLGSAPLSLTITYFMAMRTIKKINPPVGEGEQSEIIKEDKSGE